MANALRCFWGLSLLLSLYFIHSVSTSSDVHIVYLGHSHETDPFLASEYHAQLLSNVFQREEEAKTAMLYSYKHAFSGFAASLNASQAKMLANTRGVVSVFKSETLELHTTRSWDFLGLKIDYSQGTPLQLAYGDDIIVGVLDSGIWPESASFREEPGLGPIPNYWKGKCVSGDEFNPKKVCNRKLIGARYYLAGFERRYGKIDKKANLEYISARDAIGHGTHTSSIAVGSRAKNAGFSSFARGTARGGAPRARLAVYKVCWNIEFDGKCMEADILAAFDDALHDGVHVISVSIGKGPPLRSFFASSADIGSFHAMQLGVSVVFSAGNNGPNPSLVGNVNPWSICVAASTMDRSFPTRITLEINGRSFTGEGLIEKEISGTLARARSYFMDGTCNMEKWLNISISGGILLCFSTEGGVSSEEAEFVGKIAGASALVFVQPLTTPTASLSIIPVVRIDMIQGTSIYRFSNLMTKIKILPTQTAFKLSPAPVVSDFSSRGPSSISPDFLKLATIYIPQPDISAPGSNVLAAWPPNVPPLSSVFPGYDKRSVEWNFQSGTSMSCPHVSGAVALLKSAHPHWSPAAIRSALITTASNTDITGDVISVESSTKSSNPFDIGAGHLNPLKAFDPGLTYDMTPRDYIIFLCNIGYTEEQIQALVICPLTTSTKCPDRLEPNWNINYPSITVSDLKGTTMIKRTVRNVGYSKTAIYFASILSPNGVEVQVWPKILIFSLFKDEATYFITLKPMKMSRGRYDFGSITWSDGFHQVRSPLVVQVNTISVEDQADDSSIITAL